MISDPNLQQKAALLIAACAGVLINLIITRPVKVVDWFATAICGIIVAWYGAVPLMTVAKIDQSYLEPVTAFLAIVGHSVARRIVDGAKDGSLPIIGKWLKPDAK